MVTQRFAAVCSSTSPNTIPSGSWCCPLLQWFWNLHGLFQKAATYPSPLIFNTTLYDLKQLQTHGKGEGKTLAKWHSCLPKIFSAYRQEDAICTISEVTICGNAKESHHVAAAPIRSQRLSPGTKGLRLQKLFIAWNFSHWQDSLTLQLNEKVPMGYCVRATSSSSGATCLPSSLQHNRSRLTYSWPELIRAASTIATQLSCDPSLHPKNITVYITDLNK